MKIAVVLGHHIGGKSDLIQEMVEDLVSYGHQVTIISGFPSRKITNEQRQYYLDHPIEKIGDSITVKRVGSRKGEGNNLFVRMVKYVFLVRKLYKEAKNTDSDIYFLSSTPPFLGYYSRKLSKLAPVLYNGQDLFPDTLIQLMHLGEKNPLVAFLRHKEKNIYKYSTRVVTISEDMKDTLIHNGCDPDKIDVVYNWVDIETTKHVDRSENKLMDELGIDRDKFLVSYAGALGLFQGVPTMVDAAKIVQQHNPDIQFVLIGAGAYKDELERRVKEENISNISVFPMQPASRVPEVYSLGDIELVSLGKGITRTSMPHKTWQIMAAGSPIIAIVDKPSRLSSIIEDNSIGYSVEPEKPEELADAILKAYEERASLPSMGRNARAFAESNVDRKCQTGKYNNIMVSMVEERG